MRYESLEELADESMRMFDGGVNGEELLVVPLGQGEVELVHLRHGVAMGCAPVPDGETVAASAEALSVLLGAKARAATGAVYESR